MKKEKLKMPSIFNLLKKTKILILFSIVFILINHILAMILILKVVEMGDLIVNERLKEALYLVLYIIIIRLFMCLAGFLCDIIENKTKKFAFLEYRSRITEKLESEKMNIDANKYISYLNTDTIQVETALNNFFITYNTIFGIITSIIGLIKIHYLLAISTFILFFVNLSITKVLKNYVKKNELHRSKLLNKYLAKTSDIIKGYDVFFLYNVKDKMKKKLSSINKNYEDEKLEINNKNTISLHVPITVTTLIQNISLLIVVYFIYIGKVGFGAILGASDFSMKFFGHAEYFVQSLISISGIDTIISTNIKNENKLDNEIQEIDNFDIEIKGLKFAYGTKKILDIDNLSFITGKKYAIIGYSGSGKTTLANILSKKLTNYQGEIYIGGKDFSELNDFTLHHYMGYMTQKPHLFNDTIEYNISLGRDLNDRKISNALEKSSISEFNNKLDLTLDNQNHNISGGQSQRIAIARELVSDHKVIIFDEAVNSLDKSMLNEVVGNLLKTDKTVIFIAHNFDDNILKKFDEIINLNKINQI